MSEAREAVDDLIDAWAGDGRLEVFWEAINRLVEEEKSAALAAARKEVGSQAAQDVLAERRRQIEAEGWTPEHDDQHETGELARAAACYALVAGGMNPRADTLFVAWPWHPAWWKPTDEPRRNLVKAGALILAEIERLDRAALNGGSGEGVAS